MKGFKHANELEIYQRNRLDDDGYGGVVMDKDGDIIFKFYELNSMAEVQEAIAIAHDAYWSGYRDAMKMCKVEEQ